MIEAAMEAGFHLGDDRPVGAPAAGERGRDAGGRRTWPMPAASRWKANWAASFRQTRSRRRKTRNCTRCPTKLPFSASSRRWTRSRCRSAPRTASTTCGSRGSTWCAWPPFAALRQSHLVLHGGSGVPPEMIQAAIRLPGQARLGGVQQDQHRDGPRAGYARRPGRTERMTNAELEALPRTELEKAGAAVSAAVAEKIERHLRGARAWPGNAGMRRTVKRGQRVASGVRRGPEWGRR